MNTLHYHLPKFFNLLRFACFLFAISSPVAIAQPTPFWKDVPFGGGGYMTGLHFHPTVANLVYLRSDVAGPWKRTGANAPWDDLRDSSFTPTLVRGGRNSSGCGALAIDPGLLNIVYAEFSDTSATPSGGLYKSTNGGATWNITRPAFCDSNYNSGTGSRKWGQAVAISPLNPQILYYGTLKEGIYRSLDAGSKWTLVRPYDKEIANSDTVLCGTRSIALDPKTRHDDTSGVVYASIYNGGIVRSKDGGGVWSSLTDEFNKKFLALRPAGTSGEPMWISSMVVGEDQLLYVGYRYGLASFNPFTNEWKKIAITGVKLNSGVDFLALAKSTTAGVLTPRITVLGHRDVPSKDWAVFRSQTGGATWLPILYAAGGNTSLTSQASWQPPGNYLFLAPASLTLNPSNENEAYVLDAYSVWKCSNFWATGITYWKNDNVGVENIVPLTMLSSPASTTGNAAPLYTGISDVVGYRYTNVSVAPTSADMVDAGDGREYVTGYAAQETNPDLIWAVKQRNPINGKNIKDFSGITLRSTDGGKNWKAVTTDPYPSAQVIYNSVPYTIDKPSYAGAKIAVSATNWDNAVIIPGNYEVSLDTNKNGIVDPGEPVKPLNLPAKYTTDGGVTWKICKNSAGGTDLPPFFDGSAGNTAYRIARLLTADRKTGGTFYAINETGERVWRSLNGGETWTISEGTGFGKTGLKDSVSPSHLVAAPGRAGEVWAGMSGNGIFRSSNSGKTWQPINFFKAPLGADNRASLVTFGKEKPGTGTDNPTIYVYAFPKIPKDPERPVLYRCTNLKTAGMNDNLIWEEIYDWSYTGYKGFMLEGDRQNYGRVFMANGTSFSYNTVVKP